MTESGEFYADPVPAPLTPPEDDPVLTVRMQPPDTQARRLDLNTPRAVKVDHDDGAEWAQVDPERRCWIGLWLCHDDVRDWPIASPISIAAAQHLSRPAFTPARTSTTPSIREADECERPFR